FQAEDGIRDGHVTGVQTCCSSDLTGSSSVTRWRTGAVRLTKSQPLGSSCSRRHAAQTQSSCGAIRNFRIRKPGGSRAINRFLLRSEERRVGKECRSRWSEKRIE